MQVHTQKFRFGLFLIISSLSLLVLLAVVTSRHLFKKTDKYYIAYENVSVSGLEVGSPVKYLGITVGSITDIRIDPKNVNRIIVEVSLDKGTPIKQDARADIASIGITGLKMIEIHGGSNQAPLLKPGQFIRAGTSMTMQITGKAEVISEKLERLLNNLNQVTQPEKMEKIYQLVENATATFSRLNRILSENSQYLAVTLRRSAHITAQLDSMTAAMKQSAEEINRLIVSDTLKDIIVNARAISEEIKKARLVDLVKQLALVVERTNNILIQVEHDLGQGSQTFNESMKELRSSLEYLNQVSQMLSEDPSILIRGTKPGDIPDKKLEK